MKKLALHYEKMRALHPDDRLIILFDIDGTILDMRYMIRYVLKAYDKAHGTNFFSNLKFTDISVHENQVEKLISQLQIKYKDRDKILHWYEKQCWSTEATLASHRPFAGVMEVIRWFQMQPNTFVGLNTGRVESLRKETVISLNKLGEEYRVQFTNDLLYMNPHEREIDVPNVKIAGVFHFQKCGYRVLAMLDNEPDNLNSISKADPEGEILLLHANTIFESKRKRLPEGTVKGKVYDITELIEEKKLPQHIQFVWHGVNDEANLKQFLGSKINWAECDVRFNPEKNNVILRHDSFHESPHSEEEELLFLRDVINPIKFMGKSLKLDLKENGALVDKVLTLLNAHGIEDKNLWFNGNIDRLGENTFRKLRKAYPMSIIQCPIDNIIQSIPNNTVLVQTLSSLKDWGINRLSINWNTPRLRKMIDRIDLLGFDVNIYNVPDLESFLKAVLLMPRSITADFNFPKWHYFGRGSGMGMKHYRYSLKKISQAA
jgi:hypothetical protein